MQRTYVCIMCQLMTIDDIMCFDWSTVFCIEQWKQCELVCTPRRLLIASEFRFLLDKSVRHSLVMPHRSHYALL